MSNQLVPVQQETAVVTAAQSAVASAMQSRASQEVTAAMIAAKNFPRDEMDAIRKIKLACQRPRLAELSCYEYRKGGQTVTGPSIRLAEALAQAWGNVHCGTTEVERRHGESVVMAYCVDLETNYRKEMLFTVAHSVDTRQGKKSVSSERDIYELVANSGARRLRACILAVIPGDIQELAIEECEKTMRNSSGDIKDAIPKMLKGFEGLGVTQQDIERFCQCSAEAITHTMLARLRKAYASIKDGMTTAQEVFGIGQQEQSTTSAPKTTDDLKKAAKQKKPANESEVDPIERDLADLRKRCDEAQSESDLLNLEALFIELHGEQRWIDGCKAILAEAFSRLS